MKKLLSYAILILLILVAYYYRTDLTYFYNTHFAPKTKEADILIKNPYYREHNFKYVKNVTDFEPDNKQDLINIYYTVINSGMYYFTFYCQEKYSDCIQDVKDLANDQITLSNINNFIHPYNSFKKIETEYDTLGKITIHVIKNYASEEIAAINNRIDQIINEVISQTDSNASKVKKIHDYIINHSKYDKNRSDNNVVIYKSDLAYGPLIEGYGVCGGYTDSMLLFLDRFGINSIKISSSNHIWNYVYINDKWLHLDLTWDDPVTTNNTDIIDYNYFLITSSELSNLDLTQHNYDPTLYE